MWFEDFRAGQIFVSRGRTITESDISTFAAWSWDTNPVHTDAEFAQKGRFGVPIAHGLLGMSVAMGLASTLGVFEGSSIALLSVEEWRFEAPIIANDTIQLDLEIIGARRTTRGDAGILDRYFTLSKQNRAVVQHGRIGLMVAARG